jgi:putative endonuclease
MKSFSVYINYSESLDRCYIGMTSRPEKRLQEHIRDRHHWTARADDWVCLWQERQPSSEAARLREKQIKKRGARRFLKSLGIDLPPHS